MNTKLLSIVSGILLLAGVLNWPYGYYVLLRLVICVSAGILTYHYYHNEKQGLAILFGIIALLFNPIIPVYLTKSIWVFIDFIAAIIFFYSASITSERKTQL